MLCIAGKADVINFKAISGESKCINQNIWNIWHVSRTGEKAWLAAPFACLFLFLPLFVDLFLNSEVLKS